MGELKEMTSHAVLRWYQSTGLCKHYNAPGNSVQIAFAASFKSKLHDELLNDHGFSN